MTRSTRRLATLGVLGGNFLAAIEATIVATAMPTVVSQLGGLAHYSWVFAAYLLTSTVTVPLWGKLSDLYGRRRFYLAAVGFFLAGSALSGAAQSMTQLIAFRAIQGIGAGGLLPLGMIILGDLYTLRERARMQGIFSSVWGIASIAGPLVGGYITEAWSWRGVFYLNIPFGIVAAALVGVGLMEPARRGRPVIDYRGAALLSIAVTTLLVALGQTGIDGAPATGPTVAGLLAVAAIFMVAFVRRERRVSEPIVPLDLFGDRFAAPVTICGFLVGVSMFGAISFVPLFVQGALGGNATRAGSVLTPLLLGWVIMSVITGRLLPRIGYRPLVVAGLSCVSAGFLGLTLLGRATPFWLLYVNLGVMGVGMGMTMLTLVLAMQNAVERERLGAATSLGQFTRSIGGAVGVAVMGTVIALSVPAGRDALPAEMETALHRAFGIAGLFSVLALLVGSRIPAGLFVREPVPGGPGLTPTRGAGTSCTQLPGPVQIPSRSRQGRPPGPIL